MSDSKRVQIFANAVAALETITTDNGYNFTVKHIDDKVIQAPDELPADKFPALFPLAGDESKLDADVGHLQSVLNMVVTGYVKSHSDPGGDLDKLLQDVERALCVDRYRNGLAINTLPATIMTDKGLAVPYGIFDFTFRIPYRHEYGTP